MRTCVVDGGGRDVAVGYLFVDLEADCEAEAEEEGVDDCVAESDGA